MFGNSRTRAVLLVLVTFIAGGLVGAAIARSFPAIVERRLPGDVDAERIPTPLVQLGLSDDETARLHAVARRWRPKASEELRKMRRQVSELENGMFAEMLCVLTPAKREEYLHQLQNKGYPRELIEKRFALVRENRCGEVHD
jgi:hypothetical protein